MKALHFGVATLLLVGACKKHETAPPPNPMVKTAPPAVTSKSDSGTADAAKVAAGGFPVTVGWHRATELIRCHFEHYIGELHHREWRHIWLPPVAQPAS